MSDRIKLWNCGDAPDEVVSDIARSLNDAMVSASKELVGAALTSDTPLARWIDECVEEGIKSYLSGSDIEIRPSSINGDVGPSAWVFPADEAVDFLIHRPLAEAVNTSIEYLADYDGTPEHVREMISELQRLISAAEACLVSMGQ